MKSMSNHQACFKVSGYKERFTAVYLVFFRTKQTPLIPRF